MGCSNGSDMWAAMVRSDESTFWRVRRLSAANWGDMAMWEGAGVCAPEACWRRVTDATEGLVGRAWNVQDSSCIAPALLRASVWSFERLWVPMVTCVGDSVAGCVETYGRLWCLCFSVLNSFRLMAEFSAHRASAVSDTDVPWTSIAVMIWRGPVFGSGSCREQRKGSMLFVLSGFATASSITDLGAMSVTWHCDSLEFNDWQGRGSRTCVQIFRCLKSIRGLKRLSRSFPLRSGYMLSVETYTGWTKSMGPTVRWIGATCFSCKPHMRVCFKNQFALLELEGSVSPLRSFLDFFEKFCRH